MSLKRMNLICLISLYTNPQKFHPLNAPCNKLLLGDRDCITILVTIQLLQYKSLKPVDMIADYYIKNRLKNRVVTKVYLEKYDELT